MWRHCPYAVEGYFRDVVGSGISRNGYVHVRVLHYYATPSLSRGRRVLKDGTSPWWGEGKEIGGLQKLL